MNTTSSPLRSLSWLVLLMACLSWAIRKQLLADLQQGQWGSVLTRLVLVGVVAALVSWRLGRAGTLAKRRDRRRIILAGCFLFLLAGPLLSQFSFLGKSVKDVSRYLYRQKKTPVASMMNVVRHFPGTYELYLKQHFIYPSWYVQFNALVKVHLLGISPNNKVTLGKNGFYYEGMGTSRVEGEIVENFDNIADYMGQIPFDEQELRQWKMTLEQRSYWLRNQGTQYVFVLAPTKAFVYPEFLPERIQRVRGRSRYQQLSDYLHKYADIHFIDLLPPLLAAKKRQQEPQLFYKTDFHWNFYGAFIAYQAMIKQMQAMLPQYIFPLPKQDDFEMKINPHWAHRRFMYMLGLPLTLHNNEHHVTMVPKPGGLYDQAKDLPKEGIYDVYPPKRMITAPDGKRMEIRLIKNPAAPINSMVLLGDSFLEKCVYFFSADAKRVLNYRSVVNFPKEIFHYEKADIVVQEILNMFILRPPPQNAERLITGYFEDKFNLHPDQVLLAPTLSEAGGARQISLQALPASAPGEIRVGCLWLDAKTSETLTLRFQGQDGKLYKGEVKKIPAGTSAWYFEVPPQPLRFAEIVDPQGKPVQIQSLEIRTDRRSS